MRTPTPLRPRISLLALFFAGALSNQFSVIEPDQAMPLLKAGAISDVLEKYGSGGNNQEESEADRPNIFLGSFGKWTLVKGMVKLSENRMVPSCAIFNYVSYDPRVIVALIKRQNNPEYPSLDVMFGGIQERRVQLAIGDSNIDFTVQPGVAGGLGGSRAEQMSASTNVKVKFLSEDGDVMSHFDVDTKELDVAYEKLTSCEPTYP